MILNLLLKDVAPKVAANVDDCENEKVFTVDALNTTIHIIADQSSGHPILIIP